MKQKTADVARGKWHGILVALGMDKSFLTGKHGPCPFCGGRDRWRFDDKGGDGTWICAGCDEAGAGIKLVQRMYGEDFAAAAKRVDELLGNVDIPAAKPRPRTDPAIRLRKIREGAKRITGTDPASVYLRNRGVYAQDARLMYHDGLAYFDEDGNVAGHFPAMLGLVLSPQGNPLTWHVTYLSAGNKANVKAPKKIMKAVGNINGGAIRLFDPAERIGIAEGIETALAAYRLTGIPTWAALNTNGMESFIPPAGAGEVVIFADNDANYAGQKAAYSLANRLVIKSRLCADVWVPDKAGDDWADVLVAKSAKSA